MNTPIQPTAIYTRPDLRLILGRNLADRICMRSRKVARGRYLGRHVLEALERLSNESEYVPIKPVFPINQGKGKYNETNRKGWTC